MPCVDLYLTVKEYATLDVSNINGRDFVCYQSDAESTFDTQENDGIFISQDKYVADILKKFDFVTIKTESTLIETNKALLKDKEAEDVDVHLYRSMIRSLMYLKASRPDIMFDVCAYARDSPFDLEAFSDSVMLELALTGYPQQELKQNGISGEFGVKTSSCTVNAARQDLVLLEERTVTPLFQSMLVPQVVEGEGSGQPSEPQPPSLTAPPSQEELVPTVGDEAVHKELGDRVERAATTSASLDVEQDSGGSPRCQEAMGGTIAQTRSERVPTPSYDSPLLGGNTSRSDEERLEHQDDLKKFIPPIPHDSPLSGGFLP
ncbi:hypothetical protein Tco_0742141 [Tanacetum coccineum]